MSSIDSKIVFLSMIKKDFSKARMAIRKEIECIKLLRVQYFSPKIQSLVKVDPALILMYEQMIRDKSIVARRYDLLYETISKADVLNMTDKMESSLKKEIKSLIKHSTVVSKYCDEVMFEMNKIDKALMNLSRIVLDEEVDKEGDIFDFTDDEEFGDLPF